MKLYHGSNKLYDKLEVGKGEGPKSKIADIGIYCTIDTNLFSNYKYVYEIEAIVSKDYSTKKDISELINKAFKTLNIEDDIGKNLIIRECLESKFTLSPTIILNLICIRYKHSVKDIVSKVSRFWEIKRPDAYIFIHNSRRIAVITDTSAILNEKAYKI